jgi:hypothetical protein
MILKCVEKLCEFYLIPHTAMYRILLVAALLWAPVIAGAEWRVMPHTSPDSSTSTLVAYSENKEGYSLEIYRDSNDVIRTRFAMGNNLNRLDEKNCPTFQVDNRPTQNRSINDAHCLSQPAWAEYILGYITENKVTSSSLHNLMNGNTITYRFKLKGYGYAETSFSLAGSKQTLKEALGNDLVISTETGYTR